MRIHSAETLSHTSIKLDHSNGLLTLWWFTLLLLVVCFTETDNYSRFDLSTLIFPEEGSEKEYWLSYWHLKLYCVMCNTFALLHFTRIMLIFTTLAGVTTLYDGFTCKTPAIKCWIVLNYTVWPVLLSSRLRQFRKSFSHFCLNGWFSSGFFPPSMIVLLLHSLQCEWVLLSVPDNSHHLPHITINPLWAGDPAAPDSLSRSQHIPGMTSLKLHDHAYRQCIFESSPWMQNHPNLTVSCTDARVAWKGNYAIQSHPQALQETATVKELKWGLSETCACG